MPSAPSQDELLFRWSFEDGTGRHLLPADEGSFSLEGIAHAALIATHYVAEGQVRHRAPFSDKFRVYLSPPENGSWATDFLIKLIAPDTWAGAVDGLLLTGAVSLPTYAFKLLRRISNRATGTPTKNDQTRQLEENNPGDFDALIDAALPSLIRAHRVIRTTKTHLQIGKDQFSFEFNRETREYIETNLKDDGPATTVGNAAAYSVNRRTGRVYIDEIGRTVPFLLHRDASQESSVALARSLEAYASSRAANSDLNIRYLGTRAQDGLLKRIVIFDARYGFGLTRR